VPARDADYVNVYLGQQLSAADPTGESRYLVVELWRYRLAASVKICHRWVIWQDDPEGPPSRADYSVLIEDFQNLVLDHRGAALEAPVLERLLGFHATAIEFFEEHPPAHPFPGGPAAWKKSRECLPAAAIVRYTLDGNTPMTVPDMLAGLPRCG
jgi:hypothetical protein